MRKGKEEKETERGKENIFDYVAFARKMIFKKVDDFDRSKMPDSNNFFKKIGNNCCGQKE